MRLVTRIGQKDKRVYTQCNDSRITSLRFPILLWICLPIIQFCVGNWRKYFFPVNKSAYFYHNFIYTKYKITKTKWQMRFKTSLRKVFSDLIYSCQNQNLCHFHMSSLIWRYLFCCVDINIAFLALSKISNICYHF